VGLQLVNFRTFAADDDSRTRRVDANHQLVGRALHVNSADARRLQLFGQHFAQLHVFIQQIRVVFLGEPARLPALVVAQPKTVWMCFLTQTALLLLRFPRYRFTLKKWPYFFFLGVCLLRCSSALRAFRTAPFTPFDCCASSAAAAIRPATAR